eukprot:scaffold42082_cov45-Phaeocystis_antarctica.AAC.2
MLTTDGSRTAAGRRLRIMHDEHRSARPRRRRQPHRNELKEISARSTSNRRFEVLTTQLAIFGMCAQHGAAVLINHIICCRWGLERHGTWDLARIKTPHSMRVDAQAPPLRLFKKDANCHAGRRRHSAKYHPTCSPSRSNHLPCPSRRWGR